MNRGWSSGSRVTASHTGTDVAAIIVDSHKAALWVQVFPEIELDRIEFTQGMDVTFVTTAPDGEQVSRAIERISKPGRRVYMSATEIPPVLRGLGSYVLSTNKGVVSDRTARKINAGGEVLLKVS